MQVSIAPELYLADNFGLGDRFVVAYAGYKRSCRQIDNARTRLFETCTCGSPERSRLAFNARQMRGKGLIVAAGGTL